MKAKITKDMLTTATITRGQSYSIDPKEIVVDDDLNPRKDYGSGADWESFKNSIKDRGIEQAIKVYYDQDSQSYHLVHGFRRMKAISELFADKENSDEDLVNIQLINIDIVENNKEDAVVGHFVLNSGKALNDVEMAEGLRKLRALSGEKNVRELARRVGMDANKATMLLKFIEDAGEQVKKAVINGKVSFNGARKIVNSSGSVTEQNRILKEAEFSAKESGNTKIKPNNLPKSTQDETKIALEVKVGNLIAELDGNPDVQSEALNMFKAVIKALKENKDIEDIIPIFNLQLENV